MSRDLLLCLSLAHLCFLSAWQDVFRASAYYFRKLHPLHPIVIPTLCAELLLAAVLFGVVRLLRRSGKAWVRTLARNGFLLLCLIPVNVIRWHIFRWSPAALLPVFGRNGLLVLSGAAGLLVLWALVRHNWLCAHVARTMVLLCSPLIAFSAVQYAWFSLRGPSPASFADRKPRRGCP